jgi:hypothetical protein
MKFKFDWSVVVGAPTEEDAISDLANNLSTIARHLGNGRALSDCDPSFSLTKADDEAEHHDLRTDHTTKKHGPIPLNLDPTSDQGKAYAKQIEDEAAETQRQQVALERARRSDAEIMAEHSAKEQAALNGDQK